MPFDTYNRNDIIPTGKITMDNMLIQLEKTNSELIKVTGELKETNIKLETQNTTNEKLHKSNRIRDYIIMILGALLLTALTILASKLGWI